MTMLDFVLMCIGVGFFFISSALTYKILRSVKVQQNPPHNSLNKIRQDNEPLDLMEQRLQEFRNARFGRFMTEERKPNITLKSSPTWPITKQQNKKHNKEK